MTRKRRSQTDCNGEIPIKKLRSTCYFDDLPQEIIVHIFSFLPGIEITKNISLVCKKWNQISSTPSLWKHIRADQQVPTNILLKWVQNSPLLRELHLSHRNDTDEIVRAVGKSSRNLQFIKIVDCWGSQKSMCIKSKHLCDLLKKCKRLDTFHFSGVKILSCKFFQLLSTRKCCGRNKRSCSYYGPVNSKQMKALLESLSKTDVYGGASVAAAKKKIFIDLDNQSMENFESLWRDIVSDGGEVNEINETDANL
ncbi:uncharacterized protein LOC123676986 [Harmonia axyridis]|uniref:uncharacterized protein LOC123676986 n=1 Tax=Harmonia axyridis TaxID=115357 RepID=UPI001E276916|nr:uncharacterized protein LOC123676986 [Harmonia axyridis]